MTSIQSCDAEAEESLVGACLLSRQAIETAVGLLGPADFGSPRLAAAYTAIVALYREGQAVDAITVANALRLMGSDWPEAPYDLQRWTTDTPSWASVGTYASIIVTYAARRVLHTIGVELCAAAGDPMTDPADVADEVRARLSNLDYPTLLTNPGDLGIEEFLAEEDGPRAEPVIPGLLTADERVIIVATEGAGKSELTRQIVTCAAWGLDPFTFSSAPAVPALLVDLENPRSLIRRRLEVVTALAQREATGPRAPAAVWAQPGGIDVRRRSDRHALEDVVRRNRPKIVGLGPVYKTYSRRSNESDEQVAAEVQTVIDDLRTRYGFALVLEHHAPMQVGGRRELRPFGSSLWLRWPDYGINLKPKSGHPNVVLVGRWRGDRGTARWPDELHRGGTWPWEGRWRNGASAVGDVTQ